ncbi:WG repeat-containing protein [Ferruginibacter sp. SUN106]|uniref:WG repeat-containing protein n=1 Tax=Ferruginibacter sp. SUN106 TaxID=2978348 RepID=UPI003D35FBBA
MKYIVLFLILINVQQSALAQDILIPYRKDTLWGYADETGKVVVKPQFYRTEFFGRGKYNFPLKMMDNGKRLTAIVKNNGTIISDAKFYYVNYLTSLSGYSFEDTKRNDAGYKAYANALQYRGMLADNYFLVNPGMELKDLQLIDSNANVIFEDMESISIANYYDEGYFNFYFRRNKKDGLANYKGQVLIAPLYDHLNFLVRKNKKDYVVASKNGTQGLINLQGKTIIPFGKYQIKEYELKEYQSSPVTINQALFSVWAGDKQAIYNESGKKIVDFTDKDIYVEAVQKNGKEQLNFSSTERRTIPIDQAKAVEDKFTQEVEKETRVYAPAEDRSYAPVQTTSKTDGRLFTIFKKGKFFGLMANTDSAITIKPVYDSLYWVNSVYDRRNSVLYAVKDKQVGVVTTDNIITIPVRYKSLLALAGSSYKYPMREYFMAKNKNDVAGLISLQNDIVIPFNYAFIYFENNGADDSTLNFMVKNINGGMGIVNNYNQTILPEKYSSLSLVNGMLYDEGKEEKKVHYLAKLLDGNYGIISQDNKVWLSFLYDSICAIRILNNKKDYNWQSFFTIKTQGKYGIVNKKGEYIFKPVFDQAIFLINSKLTDKEYFAQSAVGKKGSSLVSNLKGLIVDADKGYSFREKASNNDYDNGVLFFTDNATHLYGAILLNKNNEIIKPVYVSVNNRTFLNETPKAKQTHTVYYMMVQDKDRIQDIFTNTGIKFFED